MTQLDETEASALSLFVGAVRAALGIAAAIPILWLSGFLFYCAGLLLMPIFDPPPSGPKPGIVEKFLLECCSGLACVLTVACLASAPKAMAAIAGWSMKFRPRLVLALGIALFLGLNLFGLTSQSAGTPYP